MSDFSAILERLRELEEGFTNDVDMELHRIAKSGDEEDLIDAIEGLKGDELQIALEDMMADLADYLASKGMNDVIDDQDKMIELLMDKIVDEYRFTGDDDDVDEGANTYRPSGEEIAGPEKKTIGDKIKGFAKDMGNKVAPDDETLLKDLQNKADGLDEASWINGRKQDDKELVWKQTSMSYEEACKKYGKENCKLGGKTGRGEDAVLVKVPLVAEEEVEESYDEEKYVDSSFDKMLNFVDTVTKMVEKPRLADAIKNIGGDPSSLYNIKQKLDNLYDNVQDGHYEAIAHLDSTSYDDMEESQDSIEECGEAGDMREQRLAQRVNELTQRLQSFKEQLSEMDPAPQDPEEIRKQQTITTNLNQMKAAGVDIDPTKGTEDPAFNKEVGSKVAAAMADPALGQQLKGVLGKVKD